MKKKIPVITGTIRYSLKNLLNSENFIGGNTYANIDIERVTTLNKLLKMFSVIINSISI